MDDKPYFFSRNISVDAFEKGPDSFVLRGALTDRRLLPYRHYLSGEMREPGIIHGMEIEMEISVLELRIISEIGRAHV